MILKSNNKKCASFLEKFVTCISIIQHILSFYAVTFLCGSGTEQDSVVFAPRALCLWKSLCACAQVHLTLGNPMDCSLSGSSVHGISQARILEWVAISSSRESSWSRHWTHISRISCIGRRILYYWPTWEAPEKLQPKDKFNQRGEKMQK